MSSGLARTALSNRIWTGISRAHLARLIEELAVPWTAAGEDRLLERRGHERKRAASAGPDHGLPFTNRVIATLVYLRFQLPHKALAELYRVDRSTVTRAIREVRPLLAARGFAVPGEPGIRLRTLADLFAYAAARGVTIRLDGTEVQVSGPVPESPAAAPSSRARKSRTPRRPPSPPTRKAAPWAGAIRPGRMHDQTALRTEGIADLSRAVPQVKGKVDAGYRGLARVPGPGRGTPAETEEERHPGGSGRLRGTTAQAVIGTDLRRARERRAQAMAPPPAVPRTTEQFEETFLAISGLVSDRAAAR